MENSSFIFNGEQSAYLDRVLRELELRDQEIQRLLSNYGSGTGNNNGATVTAAANTVVPDNCTYFVLTGSTVVTSFSFKPIGTVIRIKLSSGVILQHSLLSLQLRGGFDRHVFANDIISLVCTGEDVLGNGVWKEISYVYEKGLPAFKAHRNNANTSAFDTAGGGLPPVTIPFTTEDYNTIPGSLDLTSTTGAYTIKTPGLYRFMFKAMGTAGNEILTTNIAKNGLVTDQTDQVGSSGHGLISIVTADLQLAVNDLITARVAWLVAGAHAVHGSPVLTSFLGCKVE